MMRKLHISPNLALPPDAVTQTLVVYGGKGMGKTNFASVLAEELSRSRLKFSLLDPVGVSWGLRHAPTGGEGGIPLLILGGPKGDIPIEPEAGKVVADLVVDEEVDTLIDISRFASGKMWSKGAKIRFVADYCEQLYERQGEARRPLMQIIDEAGRYVPQQIPKGAVDIARCVGAIEELVELGRNVGVGVTLITQRSARMNKSVSELAECMIAFRTIGPNSVNSILDWLGDNVPKERWNELLSSLRTLPVGSALVVSPGWLEFEGVVPMRARETYDSSATPKAGEREKRPGQAKAINIDAYVERMADVIERAKSDDPRELRKQISELKLALKKKEGEVAKPVVETKVKTKVERVEVPMLKEADLKRIEAAVAKLTQAKNDVEQQLARIGKQITLAHAPTPPATPADHVTINQQRFKAESNVSPKIAATPNFGDSSGYRAKLTPINDRGKAVHQASNGHLSKIQQEMLDGLVFLYQLGIKQPSRVNLAVVIGKSSDGGYFTNNLSALKTSGLINYPREGALELTEAGMALASDYEAPRTRAELHDRWLGKLPKIQSEILCALIEHYPEEFTREEIASYIGKEPDGGYFTNNVSALRSLGLVEYPQAGVLRATELLFPEGLR
jgi:hypothetical protein